MDDIPFPSAPAFPVAPVLAFVTPKTFFITTLSTLTSKVQVGRTFRQARAFQAAIPVKSERATRGDQVLQGETCHGNTLVHDNPRGCLLELPGQGIPASVTGHGMRLVRQ